MNKFLSVTLMGPEHVFGSRGPSSEFWLHGATDSGLFSEKREKHELKLKQVPSITFKKPRL